VAARPKDRAIVRKDIPSLRAVKALNRSAVRVAMTMARGANAMIAVNATVVAVTTAAEVMAGTEDVEYSRAPVAATPDREASASGR
jgi:hypothetical protein